MKQLLIHISIIVCTAACSFAQQSSCVCDCVYTRTNKIKNHKYFESSAETCRAIEGKACIGTHRGESFRGRIYNCEDGPKEYSLGVNQINLETENISSQSHDARLYRTSLGK